MGKPPDNAMPFLLLAAFRGLVDEVHAELAACGEPDMRASHGFALQAIGRGCTSVELAGRLGVSKQAAAKTVATLEERGLVERRPDPTDARARRLGLTRRGRRVLALSGNAFTAAVARWRERVGDDAVDMTVATLAAVDHGGRGSLDLSDWETGQ